MTRSAVAATPDDWFEFKILKRGPTNGDLNLAVEGREKQQQFVSGFYLILQTVN